jgi:hypothetical protein
VDYPREPAVRCLNRLLIGNQENIMVASRIVNAPSRLTKFARHRLSHLLVNVPAVFYTLDSAENKRPPA